MEILFQSGNAYSKTRNGPFGIKGQDDKKFHHNQMNGQYQNQGRNHRLYNQRNNPIPMTQPQHNYRSNRRENFQQNGNNHRFPNVPYRTMNPQYQPPVEPMDVNMVQTNRYRNINRNIQHQTNKVDSDCKTRYLENFQSQASQENYPI